MAETAKPVETESPALDAPLASVDEKKIDVPVHAEKTDESKALSLVEKTPQDSPTQKTTKTSYERDVALGQIEKGKTLSFIKAWEESEKSKAENKAKKKLSSVDSWENTKKASMEAKLKKIEEQLEKKKAEYAERMKNKVALVHKESEEKRAMVEAKRAEEILKAEEMAAKYRATRQTPKKVLGCF